MYNNTYILQGFHSDQLIRDIECNNLNKITNYYETKNLELALKFDSKKEAEKYLAKYINYEENDLSVETLENYLKYLEELKNE